MKKKFLSVILAIFMFVPCMFFLTACGDNNNNGHNHEWSATYEHNETQHWKECTSCGKTREKENHTFDVGTCTVCGYVDTTIPIKKPMSKYFSGVKATYTKENFLDSDNQAREFKDLVDRQIDVLAQDILTRLNYVYGDLRSDPANEWVWGSSFELRELDGQDAYKYDDSVSGFKQVAKVYTENMLAELSDNEFDAIDNGTATLAEVNVDDLSDYQKSLLIKDTDSNMLASTKLLNLIGASSGQNMKVVDTGLRKQLESDESKQWLVSDLTSNDAKDALKLMIAQELVGDEGDDYDALIGLIDTLGYKPDFSENLIKIINNKIIGADRITEDNGYYDIIKNKYEGKITSDNVKSMNTSTDYSETNSPRLYKGYKVIVKQLVESALGNKFSSTQVSLYPKFSKKAVNYTSNANGFSEAHAYETMTLLPKDNTPYTKLVVKIKGSSIATSDVSLLLDVKINNSEIYHKRINLTNEEQTLDIDASEFGSRTLAAYKGTKDADINENIFTNTQVSDKDESNYIKFTFTNKSGVKFTVTFDGYYDK